MQQQPDSNEIEEQSSTIRNELCNLISKRDELSEAKARQDAIRDACLKTEMEIEDLLSPVVDLHKLVLEKVDYMEEYKKVVENIEDMGKYVTDQWYPMKIEMQQNIIRLQEDALSKRINQLNDEKKNLSDLQDDIKREQKETLDLVALVEATEAELREKREARKKSSSTLLKEISEREAELRHLENESLNLKEKVRSENEVVKALRAKKNITAQNIIAEEAKYHNQLVMREQMTIAFNDCKETFEQNLEKNQKILQKLDSIEKEREEDMEKLNLIINQNQDVYVERQSDYNEITNKLISEFGDVESFPQMVLEAKAKLAKIDIDCQTINKKFDVECQKETETKKLELTLLAKEAELKQKIDQLVLEKLNVGITQNRNENGDALAVETEHEFVQPQVIPNRIIRKAQRKSRSQRPQQTAVKVALNVADTTSSASDSLLTPEVTNAIDRQRRCWHALELLQENNS